MLLPKERTIPYLISLVQESPYEKSNFYALIEIYTEARDYLAKPIFDDLKKSLESLLSLPFDLRQKIDRSKLGYYVTIAELSYRQALPEGFTEVFPLDDLNLGKQYSLPFREEKEVENLKEEKENLQRSLYQFEKFCQFLLVGKIFPNPAPTNGIENTPLLRVFNSPLNLDNLHREYKQLRIKHHPDISPFPEHKAEALFYWLKKAYESLCQNWHKFDPYNMEMPRDRVEKLKSQNLTFSLHDLRYWEY